MMTFYESFCNVFFCIVPYLSSAIMIIKHKNIKIANNARDITFKFDFTWIITQHSVRRSSKLVQLQVNDVLPRTQAHVTYQLLLEEMSPDI